MKAELAAEHAAAAPSPTFATPTAKQPKAKARKGKAAAAAADAAVQQSPAAAASAQPAAHKAAKLKGGVAAIATPSKAKQQAAELKPVKQQKAAAGAKPGKPRTLLAADSGDAVAQVDKPAKKAAAVGRRPTGGLSAEQQKQAALRQKMLRWVVLRHLLDTCIRCLDILFIHCGAAHVEVSPMITDATYTSALSPHVSTG